MFQYDEDVSIREIQDYIERTYGEHYSTARGSQVIDIWDAAGSLETTARDTAIKYLIRYGKKDGKNKKDLLKAVHYIILMMYCNRKEAKPLPTVEIDASAFVGRS